VDAERNVRSCAPADALTRTSPLSWRCSPSTTGRGGRDAALALVESRGAETDLLIGLLAASFLRRCLIPVRCSRGFSFGPRPSHPAIGMRARHPAAAQMAQKRSGCHADAAPRTPAAVHREVPFTTSPNRFTVVERERRPLARGYSEVIGLQLESRSSNAAHAALHSPNEALGNFLGYTNFQRFSPLVDVGGRMQGRLAPEGKSFYGSNVARSLDLTADEICDLRRSKSSSRVNGETRTDVTHS